jgi:hypothetical protein
VANELVTNAVTASAGLPFAALVGLLIAADNNRLFVLVMDASAQPPRRQPRDDDALSGRGLQLVEAFSHRWGWCTAPGQAGKITWAILGIDPHQEAPDRRHSATASPDSRPAVHRHLPPLANLGDVNAGAGAAPATAASPRPATRQRSHPPHPGPPAS